MHAEHVLWITINTKIETYHWPPYAYSWLDTSMVYITWKRNIEREKKQR